MKLLIGLGNPGAEYADTRHNVGFMVVEAVRQKYGFPGWSAKFKGLTSKGKIGKYDVVLLLPQTFMNLSGESARSAAAFYKIEVLDTLVVHDELDLGVAALRWKQGGGDAGHNGLKSLTQHLGGPGYARLRFGIDRPVHKAQVSDYVLHAFSNDEWPLIEKRIGQIVEAMEGILESPVATVARLGSGI